MTSRHRFAAAALALAGLLPAGGCTAYNNWRHPPTSGPGGTGESLVMQGGQVRASSADPTLPPDLAAADALFQKEDYAAAESLYRGVAENKKNNALVAEQARYHEAECLRAQGHYPKAASTYSRGLQDFPTGVYRERSCARIFDIANYWLDDTRAEMERKLAADAEGKSDWAIPALVNFDKSKPTFDQEGHAIKYLEMVHLNDITGPYADKALWLCGYVKFFRGDYPEADHYFDQLIKHHKDSKLLAQATKMAIIAKNNSTGGTLYDASKTTEALRLVSAARVAVPELEAKEPGFLDRQMLAINHQQAEKDYLIAEHYERVGHPGSAYFYYDLVRRCYPGTKFAERSSERLAALEPLKAAGVPGNTTADLIRDARSRFNALTGRQEIVPVREADAPAVPETPPAAGQRRENLRGTLTGGSAAQPSRPAIPADLMPNR